MEPTSKRRWSFFHVAGPALYVAAWLAFFLTLGYAAWLAERWGPALEVVDSLQRDAHVGSFTLPCYSLVLVLDALTAVVVVVAVALPRGGWVPNVLVSALLLPSALVHSLALVAAWFFSA